MIDEDREKRRHPRLPVHTEIVGREFLLLESPQRVNETVRGRVEDVSEGGLCISTNRPLTVSFPIRCELPFADSPVPVPTLMKVQWTREISPQLHHSGLRFLV
jgi:hypothetical protein